jgi:hypothetical protein
MHLSRIGKIGAGVAIGTALVLAASPALATGAWTTVPIPTGVNGSLAAVTSTSGTDAWAVGNENGRAGTLVGAKVLIDHWDGTAWSAGGHAHDAAEHGHPVRGQREQSQ